MRIETLVEVFEVTAIIALTTTMTGACIIGWVYVYKNRKQIFKKPNQ